MEVEKRVIAQMDRCYAIGRFRGADADSVVIGTEKDGPIRRFALDGSPMETVAAGPGGVMTIAQVPNRTDQLLATSRFFSPNFGADAAGITSHTRDANGAWSASVVCELPYVHRFGLLMGADGRLWLIACTIKGASRRFKGDWSTPGAIRVAPIDSPLERFSAEHPLALDELAGCQLQNHGFWTAPDHSHALVTTAAGVVRCTPPATPNDRWTLTGLIVSPTSDVCAVDIDGDGRAELITFSAFHGDTVSVWHEAEETDVYERIWTDPQRRPFLHAIWGGICGGGPCALIGNRRGNRELARITCNEGMYRVEVIDRDRGPANCAAYRVRGRDTIIAANRETDEVALYNII